MMKPIRTPLLFIAALLLIFSLAAGCTRIPEAYTDGVRLDRAYPEDDMPLMDDAVVYYCDEDDDEITVKYGVENDLDDVADFYKDHFDDNDIELDDETDKSTRYAAEGAYKDFEFKLRVSKPSDEYARQVFKTVVRIEITFVEEAAETAAAAAAPAPKTLDEQLTGFWQQESFNDGSGDVLSVGYGIAYEFTAAGALDMYAYFVLLGTAGWSVIDENTVLLTAIDGHQEEVGVVIEQRDGKEYLTWTDSTGVHVFYRESKQTFMLNAPDSDEQLAAAIADTTWYILHSVDENGEIYSMPDGWRIYHSDGTYEGTFGDNSSIGTWYVSGGRVYCSYDDGTSGDWPVEIKTESGARYLYVYRDSDSGAATVLSDQPAGGADPDTPAGPTTYTSDADVKSYIINTNWHEYYYIYADGTLEEMTVNSMYFWPDGTLDDTYNGNLMPAVWDVSGGYLYITYEGDTEAYIYPVHIEYDPVSNAKYLYMGDLEEGFEGCNYVYTDYEP